MGFMLFSVRDGDGQPEKLAVFAIVFQSECQGDGKAPKNLGSQRG
jgi:hypothetical protein